MAALAGALPRERALAATADLAGLSLEDATARLGRGEVSPVELTEACLARIAALNPTLNAFITVTAERALAAARLAEGELRRGRHRGPLHGVPVALKDNIDTAGVRTTAATAAFAERVPDTDAEVVRRLREAGAVILGKLNMDELAYGVTSDTGYFGAVRNPWQPDYTAGGSSGGPAAAVAAALCYAALGTDTGGSIRQPAAYCGITGLKPSYGLVSTRGVIPLSWSLDHVGPMARSAADAALMLGAVAGYDAQDPASVAMTGAPGTVALRRDLRGLRVGIPRVPFYVDLDPEIEAAIAAALEVLRELGGQVREVSLPKTPSLPLLFVETRAFFDGLPAAAREQVSPQVRALLGLGGRINAARYANALRELAAVRRSVAAVFADVDVLATPTTPELPVRLADSREAGPAAGPPRSARNTTPFNIYGLPTVSIPCGFSRGGLPIGLQLSGPAGADSAVLSVAGAYQATTDWHLRRP